MATSPKVHTSSGARINIPPSAISPTPASLRAHRSYSLTLLVLLLALLLSLSTWYSYTSLNSPGTKDTLSSGLATWGCGMSWMSPGYLRMDGPTNVGGLERKYSVWWYREGGIDSSEVRVDHLSQASYSPSSNNTRCLPSTAQSESSTSAVHPRKCRFL